MTITAPTTFMGHNAGGGGGGSATVFPSRDAYAVFDGVDDYVDMGTPSAYSSSDVLSISAWVRADVTTGTHTIIGEYNNSTLGQFLLRINSTNNLVVYWANAIRATSTGTVTDGQWHHVSVVRSGSSGNWTVNFYIDGSAAGTTSGITANPASGHATLSIGKLSTTSLHYFNGAMRDVRLYDDALTSDEVTYLYTEGVSGTDPTNANLVGHWKFDDGEGGLIADSSSSGNDGQAHNITQPAFWDKYATFDGVDDQVTMDSVDISAGGSVSLWFNADSLPATAVLLSNRHTSSNRVAISLDSIGRCRASYYDGAYDSKGAASGAISAGTWYHFVYTYDGAGTTTAYLNGVSVSDTNNAQISAVINGVMAFSGRNNSATTEPFPGKMRDVRIYNDVLTADEVTYIYTAGESGTDPTENNLVGKWLLNDGEGSVVADSSSSVNDGTATNITEPLFWSQPHGLFDGVDDYVTIPLDVDLSTAGSIAFWVNPASLNNNDGVFGYDPPTPTNSEMWLYLMANGEARYRQINGSGTTRGFITSASDFSVGTWAHVVIVRSGHDTATMYLDGVDQSKTIAAASGSVPNTGDLRLGTGYSTLYGNAELRDVRLYDDALTSDEVTYLYTAGESGTDPGTANLVARYKLDDRYGTIAEDSAGANDGTATNITESTFWVQ